MKLAISIAVLVACGIGVLLLAVMLVIDMAARVDYISQKFPGLVKWAEYKPWHAVLMLIAVLLWPPTCMN